MPIPTTDELEEAFRQALAILGDLGGGEKHLNDIMYALYKSHLLTEDTIDSYDNWIKSIE